MTAATAALAESSRFVAFPRVSVPPVDRSDTTQLIEAGRIPPVADIVTPYWWAPLDPEQTPTVDILGEVSFRESVYDSVDWVLEWAPGIEPDDGDYTTIESGDGVTASVTGVLASWDISGITVNRWAHGYSYSPDLLWEPKYAGESDKPWVIGRQPLGRIVIANSDAGASADTNTAISEAHRAVGELPA